MSENLVTVKANDGIDSVSKLMAEKGIRRVVVMENEKILGVITSKTILLRLEEYVNRVSGSNCATAESLLIFRLESNASAVSSRVCCPKKPVVLSVNRLGMTEER